LQLNSKLSTPNQTIARRLNERVVVEATRVVQVEKDQNQGEVIAAAAVVLEAEEKEEEEQGVEVEANREIKDGAILQGAENGVVVEVGVVKEIGEKELTAEVEAGKGGEVKTERQITKPHLIAPLPSH